MKALVKLKREPGLWMTDMPLPAVQADEVLIKIIKTGICGTDIHIYQWDEWSQNRVPVPLIIGHEFVGEIVEVGSAVKGFQVGERVSAEGHITCGQCRNCRTGKQHCCALTQGIGYDRPGCFAEYMAMPAINVVKLPSTITTDLAAILDPLGNAVHTALSFDLAGEDVLITGAGPIGIMAVAIAKHNGARSIMISDVNNYRLQLAKQMGAHKIVNVNTQTIQEAMKEADLKAGFGIGLEMSGNAFAFNDLFEAMAYGGKVALLGIPSSKIAINWNNVIFKGLLVKGIYGREMFETWYKMISMLESGLRIEPIVTHSFPADEFQKGFEVMMTAESGKVVLDWC